VPTSALRQPAGKGVLGAKSPSNLGCGRGKPHGRLISRPLVHDARNFNPPRTTKNRL